jgi:hypothetical protein
MTTLIALALAAVVVWRLVTKPYSSRYVEIKRKAE